MRLAYSCPFYSRYIISPIILRSDLPATISLYLIGTDRIDIDTYTDIVRKKKEEEEILRKAFKAFQSSTHLHSNTFLLPNEYDGVTFFWWKYRLACTFLDKYKDKDSNLPLELVRDIPLSLSW